MPDAYGFPYSKKYLSISRAVVYGMVVVYLLNCLTHLRLHVDMLRYFAIKDCVELGCPPDSEAARDYMPWGYTGLLLILSKLGILKSTVLVLINCLYLGGSLLLVRKLFQSSVNPWFSVVLVLLNWTTIKFVTHPLSEMQYLFFSMLGLYFFQQYSLTKRWWYLPAAFAAAVLAFITRTVGVALAGALVAGLLWEFRKQLIQLMRRNKVLVGAIVLVLLGVVIFSRQLGLNHYTKVFSKQFTEGVTVLTIFKWHFTEWSEICFNMSIVKLAPYTGLAAAKLIFLLTGIGLFGGFLYLLFFRKNDVPVIVKIYLLLYSIVMFNWPFYDPRFWVPVTPLVAAVVADAAGRIRSRRLVGGLSYLWLTVYLILGVVSAAYLTNSSLRPEVMARTHANGVYRNEYETVIYGKPLSDTAQHIDQAALEVIRRYDR